MDRYDYMNIALALANEAASLGEIPVGCVIVRNGEVISKAHNETEKSKNATLHAEMIAITRASQKLNSANLGGCELYVTLEPCPMCAGAIINAKIDKVVFGAFDLKYGACGSALNLFSLPDVHSPECFGGIEEDKCTEILKNFFKNLRDNK